MEAVYAVELSMVQEIRTLAHRHGGLPEGAEEILSRVVLDRPDGLTFLSPDGAARVDPAHELTVLSLSEALTGGQVTRFINANTGIEELPVIAGLARPEATRTATRQTGVEAKAALRGLKTAVGERLTDGQIADAMRDLRHRDWIDASGRFQGKGNEFMAILTRLGAVVSNRDDWEALAMVGMGVDPPGLQADPGAITPLQLVDAAVVQTDSWYLNDTSGGIDFRIQLLAYL
jgi:hypothetical protein